MLLGARQGILEVVVQAALDENMIWSMMPTSSAPRTPQHLLEVGREKNHFSKDTPVSFFPTRDDGLRLVPWNSDKDKSRLRHVLYYQ